MKFVFNIKMVAMVALFLPVSSPLWAQDLNDAEIRKNFEKQMEIIRKAKADPLGTSRGLILNKIEPADGQEVPAPALPGQSATTTAAEPTDVSGASQSGSPTDQTYWSLPKDDQVNIRITFAFDSAAIAPKQKSLLHQLCAIMKGSGVHVFRIIGHTDAAGDAAYNQKLSMLRAKEVMRFFTDECQIEPARLEAVGVGEQFLYDPRKPTDKVNRRVEFQALS